jgi:hypothetical protein
MAKQYFGKCLDMRTQGSELFIIYLRFEVLGSENGNMQLPPKCW